MANIHAVERLTSRTTVSAVPAIHNTAAAAKPVNMAVTPASISAAFEWAVIGERHEEDPEERRHGAADDGENQRRDRDCEVGTGDRALWPAVASGSRARDLKVMTVDASACRGRARLGAMDLAVPNVNIAARFGRGRLGAYVSREAFEHFLDAYRGRHGRAATIRAVRHRNIFRHSPGIPRSPEQITDHRSCRCPAVMRAPRCTEPTSTRC